MAGIHIRQPRWCGAYIRMLQVLLVFGVTVDIAKASAFVASHYRYRIGDSGPWRRISDLVRA